MVKGWADLEAISWGYDGKGWFVANHLQRSAGSFIYVDPAGNATVLHAPESFLAIWGLPSPDGRHLAFSGAPGIANAWMIENF